MGLGDEIMAAGQAERLFRETGKRVVITDGAGRPRWHELWGGNPAIARKPGPETVALANSSGCRPYIKYPWQGIQHFTGWRAQDHIASLYLTDEEKAFAPAGHYVVIEPHPKRSGQPNRDWGFARYQELVDRLPDIDWMQLNHGSRILKGVRSIETPSFRHALAVLEASEGYVGVQGGMHHAAAALRKPAVVLVGSSTPADLICYPTHKNMVRGEHCGSWSLCEHCAENLDAITVDEVVAAVRETWLE